jgi:F0F1-type ATP synthase assembly protein I
MITHLIALVLGFVAGALVFRNNAKKAADLEQKSKSILDQLKGK